MIIGVDGNEANVQERVGVSIYTRELLMQFQKCANVSTCFNIYLKRAPLGDMPKANSFFKYIIVPAPTLWRDVFLPLRLLFCEKNDVFFSPAHYSPRICPSPLVTTIHDVSYILYPNDFLKKDLYKLVNWTRDSVKNSSKIIAVSDKTKTDVEHHYHVPSSQVIRIYNGFFRESQQQSNHNDNDILSRHGLKPHSFILYVGTLQPRKNVTTLINAFAKLKSEYTNLKLVIAGKKGWLYNDLFDEVKHLNISEHVVFTGYIPDQDLQGLYMNALAFVQPSLYEGFGIPLLEAMHFRCPSIAAKGSGMDEIGGTACLYFDPHDTIELRDKIKSILDSPELGNELILEGIKQVDKFSWKLCANETLDVLKSVGVKKTNHDR